MKIKAFLLSLLLALNFVVVAAHGQQYSGQQFKASDSFLANGAHIDAADAGNIASASTVNICAIAGNSATITGTTTITAFDTCQAGITRTLRFSGAVTLTYNGTSLIIPAAANYTTAAGDVFTFVSMGSAHWYVSHYALASGQAITGASVAGSSGDFQKNNGTGGLGAYTPTQATAALNAMVGDSGSGGTKGLAPAPAAGDAAASKFLSAGGTWAVPSGSGAGNVNGPVSSVAHDCAAFADTSGELLEDAGAACGSGGGVLEQHTASSSASLDFTTGFSDSCHVYDLILDTLIPAANAATLGIQTSNDGGSIWLGGTNWSWGLETDQGAGFVGTLAGGAAVSKLTSGSWNNAGGGLWGTIRLSGFRSTAAFKFTAGDLHGLDGATIATRWLSTGLSQDSANKENGLRLIMSSGAIASGTATLVCVVQ